METLTQLSSTQDEEKTVLHNLSVDIPKELNRAYGVSRWWAGPLLKRLFHRKKDRDE